jgi:arsenate reductase
LVGGIEVRQVREGKAIAVLIVARGEDALRLRKRLSCAARALGIELAINERRGDGGIPHVLFDGGLLFEGLPRPRRSRNGLRPAWRRGIAHNPCAHSWSGVNDNGLPTPECGVLGAVHNKERSMHEAIRVLFVCDGGSARSRMAEAMLRAAGGDRFEVRSAGLEVEALSPLAAEVMHEIDINLTGTPTHLLNDFEDTQFDYVISLCDEAKASCLSFPRDAHNLHWTCPDPTLAQGTHQERLAAYRRARDDLKRQLESWLETMKKN